MPKAKKNINDLWIVTGISRLTNQRERCSMAAPKAVAQMLMGSWASKPARYRLYLRLKVEPYTEDIFNK